MSAGFWLLAAHRRGAGAVRVSLPILPPAPVEAPVEAEAGDPAFPARRRRLRGIRISPVTLPPPEEEAAAAARSAEADPC